MAQLHFIVFVLALLANDRVRAATCTAQEVNSCMDPEALKAVQSIMAAGGDPSSGLTAMLNVDMEKLCGLMTCFMNLKCEMSPEMGEMTSGLEQMGAFCNSDSSCSIMELQKCMKIISDSGVSLTESMSKDDLKKLCPAQDCISKLAPNCEGPLKDTVDQMTAQMNMACSEGCNMDEVTKCYGDMDSITDFPNQEVCNKLKESSKCLKPYLPNCPKEIKESIENVTSSAECCDDFLKLVDKCKMEDFKKEFMTETEAKVDDAKCNKTGEMYSCMSSQEIKCTGPIKEGYSEFLAGNKAVLKECKKQGYNVTITVSSQGKTGQKDLKCASDDKECGTGVILSSSVTCWLCLVLALITWWF